MGAVEFEGDWAKLKDVLESASPRIKKESRRAIGRQLKMIEAKVLSHLDKQDLNWQELNPRYAEWKSRQQPRLSPDILRASNKMYENITTHQIDDYSGAVGVKRGVKNDGEEVTDIALIHEQPEDDGRVIPPRKMWKPTFEEMKDGVVAELTGVAIKVFKK